MNGSAKILATHRERQAVVYLRQSSTKQVLENRESALNQRALSERLIQLGWKKSQIVVIDEDQGQSGKHATTREGFQKVVAQVSLRQIGIVMGLEVSRLSRNCADWHRMLELCGLFDTLIADADGVYHPRDFNDRLLLGLKGTMSEAELHSLRLRLDGGRLSKAKRGELVQHLPTGYVRGDDGQVHLDPNAAVQERIRLVFAKFLELGSSHKVLRFLAKNQLQLPRRQTSGLHAGEVLWKAPSGAALLSLLKNPAYAGAFAYGRRIVDHTKQTPGRPATGRLRRPRTEWLALVKDVYPTYITWAQHEQILDTIERNRRLMDERFTKSQTSNPGAAMLSGLVRCGHCGRAMGVCYKDNRFQYACTAASNHYAQRTCQFLQGKAIDALVVQEFLLALDPAQIDALAEVQARQIARHRELVKHLEQEAQRLEYAAKRAEKQYDHVDPENRLIAATLEKKWESALAEWRQLHERCAQAKSQCPTAIEIPMELRDAFADVGKNLPRLWPEFGVEMRKRLLRALIVNVHLCRQDTGRMRIRIVWRGGLVTEKVIHVAVSSIRHSEVEKRIAARIRQLAEAGHNDHAIVERLNHEDDRPCRGESFTVSIVLKLRTRYGIRLNFGRARLGGLDAGYTMLEMSRLLKVDGNWLYRAIRDGRLEIEKHPQYGCYLFPKKDDVIVRMKQLRDGKIAHVSFRKGHQHG